jgi:hypothetical protein
MYRISVTTVEGFRYFLHNELDVQEYIRDITIGGGKSKYMEYGTAFHSILETPEKYFIGSGRLTKADNTGMTAYAPQEDFYQVGNIKYKYNDVQNAMKLLDYDFPFEVKKVKAVHTDFGMVNLVGKVDQLAGYTVIENKTCWSKFDWEKYYLSVQRKFYSEMFDVDNIRYNVFEFRETSTGLHLLDTHQFEFKTLESEIKEAYNYLNQFLAFCDTHNILNHFIEKNKQVA